MKYVNRSSREDGHEIEPLPEGLQADTYGSFRTGSAKWRVLKLIGR